MEQQPQQEQRLPQPSRPPLPVDQAPDATLQFRVGESALPQISPTGGIDGGAIQVFGALKDLGAIPQTRTIEADYSYKDLGRLTDPEQGLNPILAQVVDQIRSQYFAGSEVAAGHAKGSFSLTW